MARVSRKPVAHNREDDAPKARLAEQAVLGSILLDDSKFPKVAAALDPADFFTEDHLRIYSRMRDLHGRGERIDRVTVAGELQKQGQLESVGGLDYLVSLDKDLPEILHLDQYIRMVKEKALLRKVILAGQAAAARGTLAIESPGELITSIIEQYREIQSEDAGASVFDFDDLPSVHTLDAKIEWQVEGLIVRRGVTLLTGESGLGKSTFALKLGGNVAQGLPFLGRETVQSRVLYVDRENGPALVKERHERLRIPDMPNFKVWGNWKKPSPEGPNGANILRWAERYQLLIIFDSLIAFAECDEQSSTEMRAHMKLYTRLTTLGATVVIIHNTGKSEGAKDYRGSSDIKAAVDQGYTLEARDTFEPGAGLGGLRLRPFKTRVQPGGIIRLDYEDGDFIASDVAPKSPLEKLEDLIRVNPMSTHADLVKLGKNHNLAKHVIADMLLHGLQAGRFTMTPGARNAKKYSIAEPKI